MILLAGVGYSHLSDLSFGPKLVEELQQMSWPAGVQVEDLSYGPIPVIHWFEDHPGWFDQAIFAGAMYRGREPGALSRYIWSSNYPDPGDVQERVAEAVTGIISLENLLIIADHFGVLPRETSVIEMEPVELEWGLELSPLGQQRLQQTVELIREHVRDGRAGLPASAPDFPLPDEADDNTAEDNARITFPVSQDREKTVDEGGSRTNDYHEGRNR